MKKTILVLLFLSLFCFNLVSAQTQERHLKDLHFIIAAQTEIDKHCPQYTGLITYACTNFDEKTIYISTSNPNSILFLLFHEIGHYLLGHIGTFNEVNPVIEQEANSFAYYWIFRINGWQDKDIIKIGLANQEQISHYKEVFK